MTGIFLSISGNPVLGAVSAISGGNSYTLHTSNTPTFISGSGTDIGGAWAFEQGTLAHGALYGIGAAGFGVFGTPNVFPGLNVDGDPGVDGVGYGLLPAGDDLTTGNGGLNTWDFTKNSDTFLLSLGSLQNFDPSTAISNLTFQYGTALTETSIPGDPHNPPVWELSQNLQRSHCLLWALPGLDSRDASDNICHLKKALLRRGFFRLGEMRPARAAWSGTRAFVETPKATALKR